ncbi:cysteine-rich receptor-like protein kinase [Trifolium medium]|uniref:Cysteine-rich receptor-like protein kinase n=1 Tax=Trifolium medium TaxID=97028 RepID=A0A392P6V0_9FABA|nr:cysteine-rich receptor-like protein kinase [Trifolium medium]
MVIGSVISESQTAFVKDRQILDGILIANEAVDEALLVNGSPTDEFPLEKGLRQGDPLSLFLFMLAADGLNVLMQAMVENQFFSGYSLGMQNLISVSHLQFADDTLLLGTKS